MTEEVKFTVYPAHSKVAALEMFGSIAMAMSAAHAEMLKRALQSKGEDVARALADARANLEAQMKLAQIELYIHNLPENP